MLVSLWNTLKSGWSRVNDAIMRGAARRPVPRFVSPEAVAAYLAARCEWTGDPLGGVADFNLHPYRLQAAMEQGREAVKRLHVDCDDYATWAYLALLTVPGCEPRIVTLLDGNVKLNDWGTHVVCAYTLAGRHGVIDPGGLRMLPDLSESTLCRVFTDAFAHRGYRYVSATHTDYPF